MYNSLIFKPDAEKKMTNVFSKIHENIKVLSSKPAQFSFDSKFKENLEKDQIAINNFKKSLDSGVPRLAALTQHFGEATDAAKIYAETAPLADMSAEQFAAKQKAAQVAIAAENHSIANTSTLIGEYNAILSDSAHTQEENYTGLLKTGLGQNKKIKNSLDILFTL